MKQLMSTKKDAGRSWLKWEDLLLTIVILKIFYNTKHKSKNSSREDMLDKDKLIYIYL